MCFWVVALQFIDCFIFFAELSWSGFPIPIDSVSPGKLFSIPYLDTTGDSWISVLRAANEPSCSGLSRLV